MAVWPAIGTTFMRNYFLPFSRFYAAIPLMLAASFLLVSCASLPENVERKPSYALHDTGDTQMGREIRTLVEVHPDKSGFHLLRTGINAFAARLLLVGLAEKSLDIQYYIWHDDITGNALHNRILAAADRGVRVRLLLDDMDTAGKDKMLHIIDAHPNIEIRLFNPFANRDMRADDFITDTSRVNHRMHNKTLTADNQVTIFGGRNIGDEYFGASEEVGFSDLDVLAIGPVVNEVSSQFDLYWNSEQVYPLSVFQPKEPVTNEKISEFRVLSDEMQKSAKESEYAAAFRSMDLIKSANVSELDYSWGSWILMHDHPGKVEADEVNIDTHLGPKLTREVRKAQKQLLIVSPYFVPGSEFTERLVEFAKQGGDVRIMTNSLAANDVSLVHAGYKRYREALVSGGVKLYEFKPKKSQQAEDDKDKGAWVGSSRASLHGKYLGFDQRYVFIGSFNLDARSLALNTEIGALIESPEYATMLANAFDKNAMKKGYQVLLTDDGKLEWVTLEDGKEVRFDKEPETGFWQRFEADFLSIFVPESQL